MVIFYIIFLVLLMLCVAWFRFVRLGGISIAWFGLRPLKYIVHITVYWITGKLSSVDSKAIVESCRQLMQLCSRIMS